jgi:Tol biopolymer transport system component
VLYEMLTGRRAFQGEDVTETLASVVKDQPDLTRVPLRVRRLLAHCLEKDPKKRLHAIGDRHLLMAEGDPKVHAPPAGRGWAVWAAGFALALAALATVSWMYFTEAPAGQPLVHLSIPLPDNAAPGFLALSPDGRLLVMGALEGLRLRSLDSSDVRSLAGTQGARTPFWSPDSRTIAFFADRKLKTVAASGGVPQTLCEDVGLGDGGSWNQEGTILFATDGALRRVAAPGGACAELAKAEPGVSRNLPVFLPDGHHFLYALDSPDESRRGLNVASLEEPNGRRLTAERTSGAFVPDAPGASRGRLLFVRGQTLMAQPLDADSLMLSGDPVTVAEDVSFTSTQPQIAATASLNGTLVYVTNGRPDRQMVWYDRSGKEVGRAAKGGQSGYLSLSPDGKRAAFNRSNGQDARALWVQDLERGQEMRLTTPQLNPDGPVWSPDGERLAFRARGPGADAIYVKRVDGGTEEILLQGPNRRYPSDWSRDGRWLVYTEVNAKSGPDIWLLPNPSSPSADRKPVPWLVTPFLESQGQISPDGKWLAYTSTEPGDSAVYVRPFGSPASPASDTKWLVSSASGFQPRWRADGRELFYLAFPGLRRYTVMSVPVGAGRSPVGQPTALFEFRGSAPVSEDNRFNYSPSADGQRFLVNVYATDAEPSLEVLLNWGVRQGR